MIDTWIMSRNKFDSLSSDKKWNYISYLQARRTNSYLYIANNVIILISFFSLVFGGIDAFDIKLSGLVEVGIFAFLTGAFFCFMIINIFMKYVRTLQLKRAILKLTERYFEI